MQTRFAVRIFAALGTAAFLAACSGYSGGMMPSSAVPGSQMLTHNGIVLEQTYKPIAVNGHPGWTARLGYVASPNGYSRPNVAGTCTSPQLSVPNWTGMFKDGANTYCYQMIGAHPKKTTGTTTMTTQVYAYKLKFSNGDVFDPTAINKSCDSVSPYTRFTDSPLYNAAPIVNGKVKLGTIQYEDAQSVGEWYKIVKADKSYGVKLQNTSKPVVITLSVPASDGFTSSVAGLCGKGVFGVVNPNWLAGQISTAKWSVKQMNIILLWNVFQGTHSGCCILGYHGSFTDKKGQNGVFGFISVNNPGIFQASGIQDIHAAAHEIGETINDPFGTNTVPAWGHIGQQPGCQNNLEVGDPLTGTVYDGGKGITLKGFTYHPQELVYFNWFTQQTKFGKLGADDVYSMSGTFSTPAKLCT